MAAVPVAHVFMNLVYYWKTHGEENRSLKIDRGEVAGFEPKGGRMVPEHRSINVIQIKSNKLVMLVNHFSLLLSKMKQMLKRVLSMTFSENWREIKHM